MVAGAARYPVPDPHQAQENQRHTDRDDRGTPAPERNGRTGPRWRPQHHALPHYKVGARPFGAVRSRTPP